MKQRIITFDISAKERILEAFDKTIDKEGYIVEKNRPGEKILSQEGEELRLEDFAGLKKGSLVFIRSGLTSLIKLADKLQ